MNNEKKAEKYVRLSDAVRTILKLQESCLQQEVQSARHFARLGLNRQYNGAVTAGKYEGLSDAYNAISQLEVFEL